jgi:hypothetical protein
MITNTTAAQAVGRVGDTIEMQAASRQQQRRHREQAG